MAKGKVKIMSPKLRKFVAILALVFMTVFLASAMAYLIDSTLLNGAINFLMIFSGAFAIVLYLVIVFDNKFGIEGTKKRMEQAMKEQEEARAEYEREMQEQASQAEAEGENVAEGDNANGENAESEDEETGTADIADKAESEDEKSAE